MEGDCNLSQSFGENQNFNPRPPHGGRPSPRGQRIRSLKFQSTPSAWRATCITLFRKVHGDISIHALRMEGDQICSNCKDAIRISIHALRMEGDQVGCVESVSLQYFNPRPPHGGRPWSSPFDSLNDNFNPRPPHGGRPCSWSRAGDPDYFNPRPPHGGRPPPRGTWA